MSSPPMIDGAFARWLASRAGQALLDLRTEMGFADAGALKSAGDKVSHDLIRTELAKWRPGDAVLSEEDEGSRLAWAAEVNTGAVSRLNADRVWIVDPLDGTREFSEEGRSDWAVHVALWARNAPSPHGLVAGAVGLPAQHRVLGTDYPPAYPPMTVEAATAGERKIRLAASRSRPPVFLTDLAEDVGAHLVPMGSAGAKIAAVVTGEVDAYIHAGGQYEWDSAAPIAVATATGLHASRIDGSALKYNEADPRLPDLLVCRKDLATRLLAALQKHSG
ncbi:3'(2'),5'-bisphosphate nucleotidase CysQ [Micromonospora sp. PSH03]|uniref:3'(2'),5-bisphosphonucleoside 3'(2')-phosphohydrolase n=3 Tax=Micromonospora TaxID=1873 RepID=A0A328NAM3_9ACTN|nr:MULTISPECIES: 3'(2'),5'-bisphosphate nucleotidase CysQ [Micromonospora]MBM0206703.1 3'(2'),5'-bisphosphate nucleotidase CysQ [Micromonospora sp. STR1s_5]KAB1918906.1 3'(2'),5'-bisphosphate nucleotidase CysQ [Micromonospora noduli]MBQ0992136.1 3'(2'),5'-bisphosphate nucleotidase CysQ [Micromonospora sp. H61]MCG5459200.1 3'(2'),5'-bisphosphate nucleotidase CysQ [Micromonospora salmantinae]RAN98895.1 3'(2'),5'-bisphosphate nucleotidase [Micromonospora saelicesensis]